LYDVLKPKFLGAHDPVAVSFWIISIAMVAATVFFVMEGMRVKSHWKTSLTVGALVTLVAAVHYFYMREFWVTYYASPIVYRYIDWTITVPLQMIEFYLILNAVDPVATRPVIFWKLLIGTVIMLLAGYLGESHMINALIGFVVGIAGWLYILNVIFFGEAATVKNSFSGKSKAVVYAFDTMKWIVSVGWSIYPLGYFFGYLLPGGSSIVGQAPLNLIYNLADLVNKIAFCLAIWQAARQATLDGMGLGQ
jgi:bacteriorhodopsin